MLLKRICKNDMFKLKKLASCLLITSLLTSTLPVYANNDLNLPDIGTTAASTEEKTTKWWRMGPYELWKLCNNLVSTDYAQRIRVRSLVSTTNCIFCSQSCFSSTEQFISTNSKIIPNCQFSFGYQERFAFDESQSAKRSEDQSKIIITNHPSCLFRALEVNVHE